MGFSPFLNFYMLELKDDKGRTNDGFSPFLNFYMLE
ncbi:hypothetical protein HCCG_02062 [Helicobacter cinaedi CCUG 18818 = ATCC BAA-847]|uniref:Uncharacterized protein n=1 Tax=Helicobacter cinaedi CCUG 18818 = ATCC BAA-847 TaxID=537971 RepID=A0ABN0BDD4_9HELI|nr:hypothetical protein HCCG_02062 [Helicobacter cinaedi CCUG 18818 = ATCC BAA-847]